MRSVGGRRAIPVLLLPLLACGDDGPTQPPPGSPVRPAEPASITIAPSTVILWRGGTIRLAAVVRDRDERPIRGARVVWHSSDPATATIDSTGLVTAVGSGEATITATAGASAAMVTINVDNVSTDRVALTAFYETTNGTGWANGTNWFSDAPLADWYGVEVDADGRVTKLQLGENSLEGPIPREIGYLSKLTELHLNDNALAGRIPPELDRLSELRILSLGSNDLEGPIPAGLGNLAALTRLGFERNDLAGPIPPELGRLSKLDTLSLWNNDLTGPIPPELGRLSELRILYLGLNDLTGSIPPEIGNLSSLNEFYANRNDLTGPLPPEIGRLPELRVLGLWDNGLSDSIPPAFGDLAALRTLRLENNELSGSIPASLGRLRSLDALVLSHNALSGPAPPELGNLSELRVLYLNANPYLSGHLPAGLKDLVRLTTLHAGGTGLCAPDDPEFRAWLGTLANQRVALCEDEVSPAYLTQAVQSFRFPVPLVADRSALLRVFLTAPGGESVDFPPVRARLYLDDEEVHAVDIPGPARTVPHRVEEGSLDGSANVAIPAAVVQPGLELVVEVDPDETLGHGHGIARRIPETGRKAIDTRTLPPLNLTYLPVVRAAVPSDDFLSRVRDLTEDDPLFWPAREWLPIAGFTVEVRQPVYTTAQTSSELMAEIEAIRVLEGETGYYMGGLPRYLVDDLRIGGRGFIGGRTSISSLDSTTVAHELGHNMSLRHAPCGGAPGPDPAFPARGGTIGAWGFNSSDSSLVGPHFPDLMSYCRPRWISDYSFTKAFDHRLVAEGEREPSAAQASARILLLWGRADSDGVPFLEPAFVVDAPPALPRAGGPYTLTGATAGGETLFSLNFDMQEMADGDGESGFVFALPVSPAWADRLATVVLSGPGGAATLEGANGPPAAILRDPRSGRVRAIVRDLTSFDGGQGGRGTLAGAAADPASIASILPDAADLEVLVSRGIPSANQWRR